MSLRKILFKCLIVALLIILFRSAADLDKGETSGGLVTKWIILMQFVISAFLLIAVFADLYKFNKYFILLVFTAIFLSLIYKSFPFILTYDSSIEGSYYQITDYQALFGALLSVVIIIIRFLYVNNEKKVS